MDISYNDSNINCIVGNEDFLGNNYTEPNYEINNKLLKKLVKIGSFIQEKLFIIVFHFKFLKIKMIYHIWKN